LLVLVAARAASEATAPAMSRRLASALAAAGGMAIDQAFSLIH
jgi:hypothetical protein